MTGDWLRRSAKRLRLAAPDHCCAALDDALPMSLDALRATRSALVAGGPPLEASFVGDAADTLRIDFEPYADAPSARARRDAVVALFLRLAEQAFGAHAAPAVRRASDALVAPALGDPVRFGAFLGMTIGAQGLGQIKLYTEWQRGFPPDVPAALGHAAAAAMASIPGLVPLFASLACDGRSSSHRLYLLGTADVAMTSLGPAMAAAGLEDRLPDAIRRMAPFLGATAVAPRGATVLSFREGAAGVECKVELLARALELPDATIAARAAHSLEAEERVGGAYRKWLAGIGAAADAINVVGVRIAPSRTARLGVYVSPAFDRPSLR